MARSAPASEPLAKVLAEIGRGRVPPIVVTRFDPREGEDLFARDRLLSEIRRAVLGEAPAVFAETVFGAASIGLVEILDAAREVSLMAPRRLVLVRGSRVGGGSTTDEPARKGSREDERGADRDVEAERGDAGESADQSGPAEGAPRAGAAGSGRAGASAQTRAGAAAPAPAVRDEDAATLAVLDRYMAGAAKSACIAFLGCSWDGRRRIHKAVLAAATVVDTSRPDAREVPAWVSNLVRQGGGRIASDAAALLADLRGNDTMRLAGELEKLLLYVGTERPISRDDVRALVGAGEATSAWSLGEAIADTDPRRAVLALRRLLAEGEAAPMIVGAIASRLRQLIVLSEEGVSGRPNEAARKIVFPGRSVFFADALARKAARFPAGQLTRALASLYDVDRRCKSSSVEPGALLEEWLLLTLKSAGSVRSS